MKNIIIFSLFFCLSIQLFPAPDEIHQYLQVHKIEIQTATYQDVYDPYAKHPNDPNDGVSWRNFLRVFKQTNKPLVAKLSVYIFKKQSNENFPKTIEMQTTIDILPQFLKKSIEQIYHASESDLPTKISRFIEVTNSLSTNPFAIADQPNSEIFPNISDTFYKSVHLKLIKTEENLAIYEINMQIQYEQIAHLIFKTSRKNQHTSMYIPLFLTADRHFMPESFILRLNVSDERARKMYGMTIEPQISFPKTVNTESEATIFSLLRRDQAEKFSQNPPVHEPINEEDLFKDHKFTAEENPEKSHKTQYIKIRTYEELVPVFREIQKATGINAVHILPPTEHSTYNYLFEDDLREIRVKMRDGSIRTYIIGSRMHGSNGENIGFLSDKLIPYDASSTSFLKKQGGDKGFQILVQSLTDLGIQVIIDIPWLNHTAKGDGFRLNVNKKTENIIDAILKHYNYKRKNPTETFNILTSQLIDLRTFKTIQAFQLFYALKENLSENNISSFNEFPNRIEDIAQAPFREGGVGPKWPNLLQIDHRRPMVKHILTFVLLDFLKKAGAKAKPGSLGIRLDAFHVYPDRYNKFSSMFFMLSILKSYFGSVAIVTEIAGNDQKPNDMAFMSFLADVIQGPTFLQVADKNFSKAEGFYDFMRIFQVAGEKTPFIAYLATHDTNSANQSSGFNRYGGYDYGFGGNLYGVLSALAAISMRPNYIPFYYWGDENGIQHGRDSTLKHEKVILPYASWNIHPQASDIRPLFRRVGRVKSFLQEHKYAQKPSIISFNVDHTGDLIAETYINSNHIVIMLWNAGDFDYTINLEMIPELKQYLFKFPNAKIFNIMDMYIKNNPNKPDPVQLEAINLTDQGHIKREMLPNETVVFTNLSSDEQHTWLNEIGEQLKLFDEVHPSSSSGCSKLLYNFSN